MQYSSRVRKSILRKNSVLLLLLLSMLSLNGLAFSEQVPSNSQVEKELFNEEAQKEWLRKRFAEQHQQITPIVAVADMFYACNQIRNADGEQFTVKFLVEEMDKELLASKLEVCLAEDNLNSDAAVNFGLMGCFQEQLAKLPDEEKKAKMKLVRTAINSLDRPERQATLTQCVTDQAISYLK